MSSVSNWMHVEVFTVNQAASLWCGFDPSTMNMYDVGSPSEALAIKQMLIGAITTGQLGANSEANPLSKIGNYTDSLISRESLKAYAHQRQLYRHFCLTRWLLLGMRKHSERPRICIDQSQQNLSQRKQSVMSVGVLRSTIGTASFRRLFAVPIVPTDCQRHKQN